MIPLIVVSLCAALPIGLAAGSLYGPLIGVGAAVVFAIGASLAGAAALYLNEGPHHDL